ncbi:Calcium-binding protein [Angomonas deanei]|uniref:Uncharacterized protein n=1 Tax=Angomonas deanei TaxID=59799 RepID=A0A7G2CSR0_9TRYP|nr:Calcium-binding protein [Angomonas deanei]CAD2222595.1 hypothetical protein, conserved [Angomonas deanei]|eukprot:EPY19011.1 Calcium-binding protein [Angomonas deanei]
MAENPYYAAKPNFPPNRPPPVHQHHNAPPPQHRPPGNNMNYSGGYPPQGPASFDSYPPPPQARPLPTRGKFQPPQPQQPMVSQVDSSDKLQADKKKIRRGGIGKDDSKKGPGK